MWPPLGRLADAVFRSQSNGLAGLGLVRREAEPQIKEVFFSKRTIAKRAA